MSCNRSPMSSCHEALTAQHKANNVVSRFVSFHCHVTLSHRRTTTPRTTNARSTKTMRDNYHHNGLNKQLVRSSYPVCLDWTRSKRIAVLASCHHSLRCYVFTVIVMYENADGRWRSACVRGIVAAMRSRRNRRAGNNQCPLETISSGAGVGY